MELIALCVGLLAMLVVVLFGLRDQASLISKLFVTLVILAVAFAIGFAIQHPSHPLVAAANKTLSSKLDEPVPLVAIFFLGALFHRTHFILIRRTGAAARKARKRRPQMTGAKPERPQYCRLVKQPWKKEEEAEAPPGMDARRYDVKSRRYDNAETVVVERRDGVVERRRTLTRGIVPPPAGGRSGEEDRFSPSPSPSPAPAPASTPEGRQPVEPAPGEKTPPPPPNRGSGDGARLQDPRGGPEQQQQQQQQQQQSREAFILSPTRALRSKGAGAEKSEKEAGSEGKVGQGSRGEEEEEMHKVREKEEEEEEGKEERARGRRGGDGEKRHGFVRVPAEPIDPLKDLTLQSASSSGPEGRGGGYESACSSSRVGGGVGSVRSCQCDRCSDCFCAQCGCPIALLPPPSGLSGPSGTTRGAHRSPTPPPSAARGPANTYYLNVKLRYPVVRQSHASHSSPSYPGPPTPCRRPASPHHQ